ncbi:MAG: hypothetical protein ABJA02_15450 [Acidobacteriota bacterium]
MQKLQYWRLNAYNDRMNSLRVDVCLASFLLLCSLAACGGNSGAENPNSANTSSANVPANATKTNAEELGMLINIPYEAEESVWRSDPSQKKLTAVLRFSAADCDKITADAGRYRAPENVTIPSEAWFPDELIAQGDISGDDTLKGSSYGANAFFLESYNQGMIIRIEGTNYFVLEMSSK